MATGMLGRETSLHPNGVDFVRFLEVDIDSQTYKTPIRVGYVEDGNPVEISQAKYSLQVIQNLADNGWRIVTDPDGDELSLLSKAQVMVLMHKPFKLERIL